MSKRTKKQALPVVPDAQPCGDALAELQKKYDALAAKHAAVMAALPCEESRRTLLAVLSYAYRLRYAATPLIAGESDANKRALATIERLADKISKMPVGPSRGSVLLGALAALTPMDAGEFEYVHGNNAIKE